MIKCVGIVLFNPIISELESNLVLLSDEVDYILLNDNGSENIEEIERICVKYNKCVVSKNCKNMGIAYALNMIAEEALNLKANYLLYFDQDSKYKRGMWDELNTGFFSSKVGITCGWFVNQNETKKQKRMKNEWQIVDRCITSGSMIDLNCWKLVGGFNEKLFIDYVDFDYCFRIEALGYSIIRNNSCKFEHRIGKLTYYKLLGFIIPDYNHNAFRKYYITRNSLYICAAYPKKQGKIVTYLKIAKRTLLVILFETEKKEKLESMLKGWYDSFSFIREEHE